MREKRNAVLVVLVFALAFWAFWAWLAAGPEIPWRTLQRGLSVGLAALVAAFLFWAFTYEDKLPDQLARLTGGRYYERDGLCFMPMMRKKGEQALLCIYYENRYENPCNTVIHLRPPTNAIMAKPDARDVHLAFNVPGGAVGMIEQPIAVHPKLQGQSIAVEMAAAVNYPHTRGEQLRSCKGMPCGTFHVDWGTGFRTGVHELSGELELIEPVKVWLSLPMQVSNRIRADQHWRQQVIFQPT